MTLRQQQLNRIIRKAELKNIVKSEENLTELPRFEENYLHTSLDSINKDFKDQKPKVREYQQIIDKVNNMSNYEKVKSVLKYLSNFSNIQEAAKKLLQVVNGILIEQKEKEFKTTQAQLSKTTGKIAAILWVISVIVVLGAAGSDSDGRNSMSELAKNMPDDNKAMLAMVASIGVSSLVTYLSWFLKKREDKKKKEAPNRYV